MLCKRHTNAGGVSQSPKSKYLIPGSSGALELQKALREDIGAAPSAALHLYINDSLPVDLDALLSELDVAHRAADGFLHVGYSALSPTAISTAATTSAATDAPFVSPHGDRVPMGASVASCTFLNPRGAAAARPELKPSHGGRVPAALFAAVVLDVMAVGLVVPLLATYSRHLGGGPRFTGVLQATYGLTQLLGANMLGGLSDSVGRRRMLQTSMLGGLVGYTALALSLGPGGGLWLLLASRLPIGLLKQSLAVARAAVADCTSPASRMRPLSLLGAAVGSGFVVGPALGGILSKKVALHAPPALAAALFGCALLVVTFALPETAPLPLTAIELRHLVREAEARWRRALAAAEGKASATTEAPATAATGGGGGGDGGGGGLGALPVAVVHQLCAEMVTLEWRPHGERIASEEEARAVAQGWAGLASQAPPSTEGGGGGGGGGGATIGWAAVQEALAVTYLQYKEANGMLQGSAPTPGGGGGGGGGSGGATSGGGSGAGSGGGGGVAAVAWRSFDAGRRLLQLPRQVKLLSATRGLVDLSVILVHSVFADYARLKFGWEAKQAGFGMAFAGLCSVLVDFFVLPLLLRRQLLRELPAALGGAALVCVATLCMALGQSVRAFLVAIALLSLGVSLFKAAINTIVINAAPHAQAGLTSGLSDAVEALCRSAAPLAGGLLLEHASLEAPPLVATALCAVGALAVYEAAPPELQLQLSRPRKPKAE